VVFPLLLAGLSFGCGRLVELAAGERLPGPLVLPLGLALVILAGEFATLTDTTAELAAPLAAALAIVGLLLGPIRRGRPDLWALGTALAVFAVFAAPVVLSGEATFAGYIKLDDTATYFAMTDRVMEHARDLAGLAPSTYEATLATTLGVGYPTGVLMPIGIGHASQEGEWQRANLKLCEIVGHSRDGIVGRSIPNRHRCPAGRAQAVSRSKSAHTGTWSDGFSQART